MNFKDGYGTCKWCGQTRTVMRVPVETTQEEMDKIASSECNCEGAEKEREVEYLISTAGASIRKIVQKRSPDAARILQAGAEAVARKYVKKITVNVDGMLTASMYLSSGKIIVESRKTEVYQSDGELEDGMPADEDPGETNAEAEN